jgi:hypothetical protein
MFKFLFDCSAFEISTNVQAINNILFPVVLFVIIFWLMCEIFLVEVTVDNNLLSINKKIISGVVKTQIHKNILNQKDESNIENLLSNMTANIDSYKTGTELFDIDKEHQNLQVGLRT